MNEMVERVAQDFGKGPITAQEIAARANAANARDSDGGQRLSAAVDEVMAPMTARTQEILAAKKPRRIMVPPQMIPVSNPGAAYLAHRTEIDTAIARVLASGRYILGPEVEAFEAEFAAWLGAEHCIACASGTDALILALKALGIGPGATVAAPSFTAVATIAAICLTGATPLLLDIEPAYYTLDPAELARVLYQPPADIPPIRAVIAVHLYGQPCDMKAIADACRWRGAALIEDCAQATGATLDGQKVGTFGDAAAFSFYPTKNLAALGDGGAVVTRNTMVAYGVRSLRQYGWNAKRIVRAPGGMNSRLDEVQAAVLRTRIGWLDADLARRREIATRYDAALRQRALKVRDGAEHGRHLYVIRDERRDGLLARLANSGIGSAVHYDPPIHHHPTYLKLPRSRSELRLSEYEAKQVLSIPLWPEMTDDEVGQVCDALERL